jgi:hypothetical protein
VVSITVRGDITTNGGTNEDEAIEMGDKIEALFSGDRSLKKEIGTRERWYRRYCIGANQ